jgi:hypothetical protein
LIPENLFKVLLGGDAHKNTLTFLACGGVLRHTPSRESIRMLAKRYAMEYILNKLTLPHPSFSGAFAHIMAFGQMTFHPINADSFLMDIALNWFIHNCSPMSGMLRKHTSLGSHSDVFMFFPDGHVMRYTWSHPVNQPFGQPSPFQCPQKHCRASKPWVPQVKMDKSRFDMISVKLTCRHCGHSLELYEWPDTFMKHGAGPHVKSDSGDWYYESI